MFNKITSFWDMVFGVSNQKKTVKSYNYVSKKPGYTPTYVLISEDLNHPQEQVFEAAVYYLCVIAQMKKEYQNDILAIFDAYLKNNKKMPVREAYLRDMLQKYNFSEFIHN